MSEVTIGRPNAGVAERTIVIRDLNSSNVKPDRRLDEVKAMLFDLKIDRNNNYLVDPVEMKPACEKIAPYLGYSIKTCGTNPEKALRMMLHIGEGTMVTRTIGNTTREVLITGLSLIGNGKPNLSKEKWTGFNGAKALLSDYLLQLFWQSVPADAMKGKYPGVVCELAKPINVKKYAKLVVYVMDATRDSNKEYASTFEATIIANDKVILANYYEMKYVGQRYEFDLTDLKADALDPLTIINKLSIITRPGEGNFILSMWLEQ